MGVINEPALDHQEEPVLVGLVVEEVDGRLRHLRQGRRRVEAGVILVLVGHVRPGKETCQDVLMNEQELGSVYLYIYLSIYLSIYLFRPVCINAQCVMICC